MKVHRGWIAVLLLCACGTKGEPRVVTSGGSERVVRSYSSVAQLDVSAAISTSSGWVVSSEPDGAVFLVDKSDSVVWRTPGKGRGPGELLSIRAIALDDSAVSVYDGRQRRIVRIRRTDGRLIGQTPLPSAIGSAGQSVVGFLRDGRWLLRGLPVDYRSLTGAVRPSVQIWLSDSTGKGALLGSFRESEILRGVQEQGSVELVRPLGKHAGIAITNAAVFVFDGDSLFRFASRSDRPARETVGLPPGVDEAPMTDEIRRWGEGQIESSGALASRFSALYREIPPPKAPPAWGAGGPSIVPPIVASLDGSIFLRRFTGGKSEEWWRLVPGGMWQRHLFPDGQQVVAFSDTTALVLTDHEGSSLLKEILLKQ